MPDSHFHEIRQLPLFGAMEDAHFDRLMHAAYVQNFPPQIDLIEEGDPSDFLHVLVSGSVEYYSTWSERETVMATVHPITTFILAATIRDAPYLMSVRTLKKSRVVLLPSKNVRDVFALDAGFARAIVMDLANSYRAVVRHAKDLKLRTSLERLANYLLRVRAREGGADSFVLLSEKRRLASFLGMTPENLSRAFKGLQAHGVTVEGSRVTIRDAVALVAFARPSPLIDDPQV